MLSAAENNQFNTKSFNADVTSVICNNIHMINDSSKPYTYTLLCVHINENMINLKVSKTYFRSICLLHFRFGNVSYNSIKV